MDPNTTLKEIRELCQLILGDTEASESEQNDWGYSLADRVESLDNWIIGGGFLPEDWKKDI